MKILMVIYMFPPVTGGGEQGAYELAKTLVKLGHEVHVATTHFDGLEKSEVMDGIKVHRIIDNPFLGPYKNPQRKNKIASSLAMVHFMLCSQLPLFKLVKLVKPDVINAQFILPAGLPAMKASMISGVPLVTSLIGGDLYTPGEPFFMGVFRKKMLPIYKLIFSRSTLTAISTDTIKRARGMGCRKDIALTPYGIDVSKFKRGAPEKALVKKYKLEGKPVLISVCRLSRRKGLEYLLRAMPDLDAKLLIIGDGVERNTLKKLTRELGIENKVTFIGAIPNDQLFKYYNLADIFVLPSLHEGMGIVFLEAMASGLPVITTNIGGMVDFVMDGKTGLLVEPKNPKQLEAAIKKLLRDKRLRERIAKDGEKLVRSDYTWEEAAKRYLRAFGRTING